MNERSTFASADTAQTAKPELQTATCRPGNAALWGGLFFASFGIAAIAAGFLPNKNGEPIPAPAFWFFIMGGVGFIVWGGSSLLRWLRVRIVADETGLRWRGAWHGWKTATWAQVSDYYTQKPILRAQSTASVPVAYVPMPIIVTENGTINTAALAGGYSLSGVDDLKRIVQARATAARADRWQPLGTRRVDDFPQTFRYFRPGDTARFTRQMVLRFVLFFSVAVGFLWVYRFVATNPFIEPTGRKITCGVLVVGYGVLLAFPVGDILAHRKAWKRRGESITVTTETVRHDPGTGAGREWAWHDVSDYFYRGNASGAAAYRYTLTLPGDDEPEITWDNTLHGGELLLAIVREYAPTPPGMTAWRDKGVHERTGGSDPATWQSGVVGMGGRVFRYRSELMKVLCVFGAVFMVAAVYSCFDTRSRQNPSDIGFLLSMVAFFALLTAWSVAFHFCARIETDDMGITRHTPFGKTYLPWYAVTDYREGYGKNERPTDTGVIIGQNGKRTCFFNLVHGYEELRGEITRNAPAPRTGFAPPRKP